MSVVYVASSWRNARQPEVVEELRAAGHAVYDFRAPDGRPGLGAWPERCGVGRLVELLAEPRAVECWAHDLAALRAASHVVLVLPAGRAAHTEVGLALGLDKPVCVLLPASGERFTPELVYAEAYLAETVGDVVDWLVETVVEVAAP
jgi:hypothetical protein